MATSIGQYASVFLPGDPLLTEKPVGHNLQGCKELDMTEVTLHAQTQDFFLPVAALPQ